MAEKVHYYVRGINAILCGSRAGDLNGGELTASGNVKLVTCKRCLRMMANKTTSAGGK